MEGPANQTAFGNGTPSVDTIANEMLREDMRKLCESSLKGGGRAFDDFYDQAIQFMDILDQFTCPTDVDIEKVAVFDVVDCNGVIEAGDLGLEFEGNDEGQEIPLDVLLDELDTERQADLNKKIQRGRSTRVPVPNKDRKGRLDSTTLDALAKMLDELPDEPQKRKSFRRKSNRRKAREQSCTKSTEEEEEEEDFSTRPLPGETKSAEEEDCSTRPLPGERRMSGQVFNFNKLATEMNKSGFQRSHSTRGSNRQETVTWQMPRAGTRNRRATNFGNHQSPDFQRHEYSKTANKTKRQQPMIAADDWEYLEEQSISSQKEADPIISSKPTPSSGDRKSRWRPIVRKLSLLNKGKNQLGRYRSIQARKRDKISVDDDGSVQVDYRR